MDIDYSGQSEGSLFHARGYKIRYLKRKYLSEKERANALMQLSAIEVELCRRGCVSLHKDIAQSSSLILWVEELETTLVRDEFIREQEVEIHKLLYTCN